MNAPAFARLVVLVLLVLSAMDVGAEESNKPNEPSSSVQGDTKPSDIAKQLHNPLSNLREIIFQLDGGVRLGGTSRGPLDSTNRPRIREAVPAIRKTVAGLRASWLQRGSTR